MGMPTIQSRQVAAEPSREVHSLSRIMERLSRARFTEEMGAFRIISSSLLIHGPVDLGIRPRLLIVRSVFQVRYLVSTEQVAQRVFSLAALAQIMPSPWE